jgi:diaminopropionate ammonia-lyase
MSPSPEACLALLSPERAAPTPLLRLPRLAEALGVAEVFAKDETRRPLGNFKALGGVYAALRAAAGRPRPPALLCASAGNHGLSVAVGGRLAGVRVVIYLPRSASPIRAARIEHEGATIVWVDGDYDDAARAAVSASQRGDGALVADTSDDEAARTTLDVMAGYGLLAREIAEQLPGSPPTHLFLQAGVGGLAAALTAGLPGRAIVVEPETAACVGAALSAGRAVRLEGDLATCAEMLACRVVSAPALKALLARGAVGMTVSEAELQGAVATLARHADVTTTPSGAAGLAGLIAAAGLKRLKGDAALTAASRVVLVISEGRPADYVSAGPASLRRRAGLGSPVRS